MPAFKQREKVRVASGGTSCAAWHYPGSNGGCVIMAGGTSVIEEPASDLFVTAPGQGCSACWRMPPSEKQRAPVRVPQLAMSALIRLPVAGRV